MSDITDLFATIGFLIAISFVMLIGLYFVVFFIMFGFINVTSYFGDYMGMSKDICGQYIECHNENITIVDRNCFWFTSVSIPERICYVKDSNGVSYRANGVTTDFAELNKTHTYLVTHDGFNRLWTVK